MVDFDIASRVCVSAIRCEVVLGGEKVEQVKEFKYYLDTVPCKHGEHKNIR